MSNSNDTFFKGFITKMQVFLQNMAKMPQKRVSQGLHLRGCLEFLKHILLPNYLLLTQRVKYMFFDKIYQKCPKMGVQVSSIFCSGFILFGTTETIDVPTFITLRVVVRKKSLHQIVTFPI